MACRRGWAVPTASIVRRGLPIAIPIVTKNAENHPRSRRSTHGTTVTRVSHNDDGSVCKAYRETVHTRVETVTKEATACRNPGGGWHMA